MSGQQILNLVEWHCEHKMNCSLCAGSETRLLSVLCITKRTGPPAFGIERTELQSGILSSEMCA